LVGTNPRRYRQAFRPNRAESIHASPTKHREGKKRQG
jgi:hypothetical protein